jgi:predicted MFS family arabinose efflux permease
LARSLESVSLMDVVVGICPARRVLVVGIAVFCLVTSELFPVGILSAVSADLATSTPRTQ